MNETDGHFFFDLQVSTTNAKMPLKSAIIANKRIKYYIGLYKSIYEARKSILFEGFMNPSKLNGFTKEKPICMLGSIKKYVSLLFIWFIQTARSILFHSKDSKIIHRNWFDHFQTLALSQKQSSVFQQLYNSTVEALVHNKGFSAIVNGYPGKFENSFISRVLFECIFHVFLFEFGALCLGSGKSQILLEMIVCLATSEALKNKPFRILVTGHNHEVVHSLSHKLCSIRNNISAGECGILFNCSVSNTNP